MPDTIDLRSDTVTRPTSAMWEAMRADWESAADGVLRVDGGMAVSDWAMQFLADIIDAPVDRPKVVETTAVGAAWLAGMRAGVYPSREEFARSWALERRFEPEMGDETRATKYDAWKRAVAATLVCLH